MSISMKTIKKIISMKTMKKRISMKKSISERFGVMEKRLRTLGVLEKNVSDFDKGL